MKKPVFQGTCTALVTPFGKDSVDIAVLHALLEHQLAHGVEAVVLCGTTGEAATMTEEEQLAVIREGAAYVGGRMTVIAGTGSNNTAHAIALSQKAAEAGADAVLVVSPYYNKATPVGLIRHYTAIADCCPVPVLVYNVPSRTGQDIPIEVYEALSRHPNINGVKEASGNIAKVSRTIGRLGSDFHVWSGNDDQNVPILSLGGKGVISVLSNVCPGEVHDMVSAARRGDFKAAASAQNRLMPLIDALFCEVNPIPVKAAMKLLGCDAGSPRLPLTEMEQEHLSRLRAALRACLSLS